jgi:Family of unknown function (DUF5938)/Saccharopine dehydrogenase NADP binding domain
MSNAQVVVYGASGYTGKLVAAKLAARHIPFIAAGRNKARLDEQLGNMSELKGASYECVAVEHSVPALTSLFRGKAIVYNLVGPFMQLGNEVVQACLGAGCHYTDATGEQDWMFYARKQYGPEFAKRKLLLIPANSCMWTAGQLVAELCLETGEIDSLDILYVPKGQPTVASTLSFIRMCCQPQYYLEDNRLIAWPAATAYTVAAPGMHATVSALPWSGGGETVWYEDDRRVRNCRTLVSFTNQAAMAHVLNLMREFDAKYKHASREEQERATNTWGNAIMQGEPPREDLDCSPLIISCYGRGRTKSVHAILWASGGYTQTAALAAFGVERVLQGKILNSGFSSPAAAFGARDIIEDLSKEDLAEIELRVGLSSRAAAVR